MRNPSLNVLNEQNANIGSHASILQNLCIWFRIDISAVLLNLTSPSFLRPAHPHQNFRRSGPRQERHFYGLLFLAATITYRLDGSKRPPPTRRWYTDHVWVWEVSRRKVCRNVLALKSVRGRGLNTGFARAGGLRRGRLRRSEWVTR